MLKVGQEIKAKWDGAISVIVKIEKGIVTYDCRSYKNQHNDSEDKNTDGLFRDTEFVINEHFYLL
jgi:hypothetical protein